MHGGEYGSPTTCTLRSEHGPAAAVAVLPVPVGAVGAVTPGCVGAPGSVGAPVPTPGTVVPPRSVALPVAPVSAPATTFSSRAIVGTSVTTSRNATARASNGP